MLIRILVIVLFLISVLFGYGFLTARNAFFAIYDVPLQYRIGAVDADLEIVEFLNYECQKCRDFFPGLTEAVRRDGKVRLIVRPVAENSDWSKLIVYYVYAAGEQGKFKEMHGAIIKNWPVGDELALIKMAETLGMDMEQLRQDIQSPEVKAYMKENQDLYLRWNIEIVPAFFMGRAAVYRPRVDSLTAEEWLEKFERARAES